MMWQLLAQPEPGNADERSFWINILSTCVYSLVVASALGLWWLIKWAYRNSRFSNMVRWCLTSLLGGVLGLFCIGVILVVIVRIDKSFGLKWGMFGLLASVGQNLLDTVNVFFAWLRSPALPAPPWWLIILAVFGAAFWVFRRHEKRLTASADESKLLSLGAASVGLLSESAGVPHAGSEVPREKTIEWRQLRWLPEGSDGWIPLCPRSDCGSRMALRSAVSDRPGVVIHRNGPINVFAECSKCKHKFLLNMTRENVMRAVSESAKTEHS